MLIKHEGVRLKVYDDANGKSVVPGYQMIGHPTVGVGRALDVNGVTQDEAMILLAADIKRVVEEAERSFPWFKSLDTVRQDVILSMLFNVGLGGLLKFKNLIEALRTQNYQKAADEMLLSRWRQQVGKRADDLAQMMRTGIYK
jgi:lysozyme